MASDAREWGARRHILPGQATRASRFIARVDAYLPMLKNDAARRHFLDRQLDGWERRYARFLATGGECEPVTIVAAPPQAADFLLTIAALAARRGALEKGGTP